MSARFGKFHVWWEGFPFPPISFQCESTPTVLNIFWRQMAPEAHHWRHNKYSIIEYAAIGFFPWTYTSTISPENVYADKKRREMHYFTPSSPSMFAAKLEWMDCLIPLPLHICPKLEVNNVASWSYCPIFLSFTLRYSEGKILKILNKKLFLF